jgi:predicted DNA-binding helix-hairpin-helix protein
MIVTSRRYGQLTSGHLQKMGVAMKRARFFITCNELAATTLHETGTEYVRKVLTAPANSKKRITNDRQLTIDFGE